MAITITTVALTDITGNSAKTGGDISGAVTDYHPIVDRLLMNRFQLQKASCQKITGTVKSTSRLTPFMLFEDANQANKKFVLTSFRFKPCTDLYDIQLNEYDNTETIILNEIP